MLPWSGSRMRPQAGRAALLLQVYVHELSHNLYLGHAGAYNSAGAFDE